MPRPSKTAVVPHRPAPPPDVIRPQAPSLFQTMQEGLAFGVGSSVARNMIDRVMQPSALAPRVTCVDQYAVFDKCILTHDDVSFCMEEHDNLKKCIGSRT
jgi:hypothetical protein